MTKHVHESAIEDSVRYLESDPALRSIDSNVYWPKWDSPWWHITLLHEMGLAKRIPERVVHKMTEQLKASPLTIFPIHAHDVPEGVDAALASHCHCGLGNIYQALQAAGLDIDRELPWIRPWFLKYQLHDGGLNCDETAYVKEPPPSSMVGTISPLEAILLHTSRPFTSEEKQFLDRGAQCLLERKLMHATSNSHNAEERGDEEDWLKVCFPRFYLYDVLRGLSFVLKWSDRRNLPIPKNSISPVVQHLKCRHPDGQVRLERRSFEGIGTRIQNSSREWVRCPSARFFTLLDEVCQTGNISPWLTKQLSDAFGLMNELSRRGLIQ